MSHRATRRNWLKTVIAGSALAGGATGLGTAGGSRQFDAITVEGEDPVPTQVVLKGEDGDQFVFPSRDAIDWESIPDGEYEIVQYEKHSFGTARRHRQTEVRTAVSADSQHPGLTAIVGGQTHQSVFTQGSTVPIFIGAADGSGIIPKPASDPVDITITVTDPDGQTEEFTDTINNGLLRFTYNAASDATTGQYSVSVNAVNNDGSATTSFDLGRIQSLTGLSRIDFPGQEQTIGVNVTENGDPADADATVDITYPDGSEETRTVTAQNGVGTFSVTPQETGRLQFETPTDRYNSIDIAEYMIVNPDFELREQKAGNPVEFFGYVQTANGPAASENFSLQVTDTDQGTTVLDTTITTDSDGLFTTSWESDPDTEQNFQYRLSTTDTNTLIRSDTVSTSLPDGGSTSASLSGSYDVRMTAPGEDATVTVSLTDDNGDPVSGQDIDLTVLYSFRDVPVEHTTVTTGSGGEATYTFTVPSDAPDGADFRTAAGTTLDGQELTAEIYGEIARYETGFFDSTNPRAGQSWDFTVTSTKPPYDNDEAVPNQSMRIFTGNDSFTQTIYDTASVVTDSNGEASVTASIGADAQNRLGVDIVNDYWTTANWLPTVQRFDGTINGVPDSPTAGETLSVSVTDGNGDERRAVVLFESFSVTPVVVDVAEPGTPAEITIPEEASGENGNIEVFSPEGGLIHRQREFFDVGETTVAAFNVAPSGPITGETVTFDGSASSSATGDLSYDWDLTGDGSTDATGQTVEWTYDTAADYTVSLTVTDGDGTTDEATTTVTVSQDPVDEYRDESGDVDTNGVRSAVSDWLNGSANTDLLQQVIEEWTS